MPYLERQVGELALEPGLTPGEPFAAATTIAPFMVHPRGGGERITLPGRSHSHALKHVLQELKGRVEEGEPLGESMARYPRVFSSMGINMVRAGMEGGFLEDALDRVGEFTELQEDLKGRTISALAYPIFLSVIGTAVR